VLVESFIRDTPQIGRRLLFYLQSQRWSRRRLHSFQDRMLRRLVLYAYHSVPYYRRMFDENRINPWRFRGRQDLNSLPLLSKADLRRYIAESPLVNLTGQPAHWEQTSGSTGTPLRFLLSPESKINDIAAILRSYLWAGYFPGRKVFSAKDYFAGWTNRYSMLGRSLDFDINQLSAVNAKRIWPLINRLRPRFFHGYPFSLMMLAVFAEQAGLNFHKPEVIISISESLSATLRESLTELYDGARIFNVYSMAENCALASDCEQGVMHLAEDFAYHEILRPDGTVAESGSGEIIATGFYNLAMPLLRYRTSDLAEVLPFSEMCACGRNFRIVKQIQGRVEDFIRTPEGKTVNLLERPMNRAQGVLLSQYVQDRLDHIYVNIVPAPDFAEASLGAVERELKERLGSAMKIDFRLVEKLESRSDNSAKVPFLLSKIGNSLY